MGENNALARNRTDLEDAIDRYAKLILGLTGYGLLALPCPALANSPLVSTSLRIVVLLLPLYLIALIVSGRHRGNPVSARVFALFGIVILIVSYLHLELLIALWSFAIGINFCLSLLLKDRVVYKSRRHDLIWYGVWTGLILVGSLVAKVSYWADKGGFRAYVIYLSSDGMYYFGIVYLVMMLVPMSILLALHTREEEKKERSTPSG